MAEIFGDMALGASDKDDGDDVAEEDEMVEMPDFFARVRPLLMSARGTPRLIVQLAPWLVLSGLVLMPVALWMIPGVGTADSCCFQTAFEARRAALMGLPFVGGLSYLPFVCRAIKPETGPLAKLGVGTKKVAASHVARLQKWRNVLMIPAILCFLFSLSVANFGRMLLSNLLFDTQHEDIPRNDILQLRPMLLVVPGAVTSIGFGYPMAIVWYFSMKVGVTLAEDEVMQVARRTTPEALKDDSTWSTTVAQPAIDLATGTLAHLSSGYGTGTGWTAFMCAWISVANFFGIVHKIRGGPDDGETDADFAEGVMRKSLGCVGAALFIVAVDLAAVSTRCDRLLKSINSLRLSWASTEEASSVHLCTFPLQCTLKELNNGQGLGFVVFSKVIDKKTLNLIAFSVASFFGTVIPLIMAFMPDPPSEGTVEGVCLGGAGDAAALARLSRMSADAITGDGDCLPVNATVAELLGGDGGH
jgi:hypothetical protein